LDLPHTHHMPTMILKSAQIILWETRTINVSLGWVKQLMKLWAQTPVSLTGLLVDLLMRLDRLLLIFPNILNLTLLATFKQLLFTRTQLHLCALVVTVFLLKIAQQVLSTIAKFLSLIVVIYAVSKVRGASCLLLMKKMLVWPQVIVNLLKMVNGIFSQMET